MITEFLEGFMEDKCNQHYESEERKPQNSHTEVITADNFVEKVIDDTSFEHCMIEIFAQHCPGCGYVAKLLEFVTNKMKNLGLLKDFKIFQIDNMNTIPWVGNYNYTPVIIYVRKDPKTGAIIELNSHTYTAQNIW